MSVVQGAGEEAGSVAAAAPGDETSATAGRAAAEERCSSQGTRGRAGQTSSDSCIVYSQLGLDHR